MRIKKFFLIFTAFTVLFVGFFLIFLFPFIKADMKSSDDKAKIIEEILRQPNVREISNIEQIYDWKPVFDLYVRMNDGVKLIFRNVSCNSDSYIHFDSLTRIGDFGFLTCYYDCRIKKITNFSYGLFNEYEAWPIKKIGESVFASKNVLTILENYKSILATVSKYHVANDDFLILLSKRKDEEAFKIYDGNISNGRFGLELNCIYFAEANSDTFFGSQAEWKENSL